MKIYTRTGDAGETGLYGGERVAKDSIRVMAYGTVDEASSAIGLARATLQDSEVDGILAEIQNALFELGADLATPMGARQREKLMLIDANDATRLEELIDLYDAELQPLQAFVLPGGTAAAAALHLARAVVRRAEREFRSLSRAEEANPHVGVYLNRLSDLLFTLARVVNMRSGISETRWQARGRRD